MRLRNNQCFGILQKLYLYFRGCSFLSKAINAEKAGAAAVIIMDNDHSNYERFIDMIQDETNRKTMLPAYFLLGKDG